MKLTLNCLTTIALLLSMNSCKVQSSTQQKQPFKSVESSMIENHISEAIVKKHLYTLADDAMEGRKSGTKGIEKAAQYIESEFAKLGLETFKDALTYRQNFTKNGLSLFNLIGVLKGKSKPDQYVVISAHYDHLGIVPSENGDTIANGADDDASGVSAVLALASYFKAKGNERTIIFVTFTGEEMGMLGSTYFGKQIDAQKYIAGINIEMIGKESKFGPKTAWLTGFDRSDFGTIIQKNLKGTDYTLHPDPYPNYQLFYRSDNASLAKLGIPAHTFSTGPIDADPHYHKASDEPKTLNMKTIANTIKAIAIGVESIINGQDTPTRLK